MVLIPITIDPFARFGPMFQSFLTSTESRPQEPWFTTHRNNKFNRPYANLMYETALHTRHPNFSRLLLETIRLTYMTDILR